MPAGTSLPSHPSAPWRGGDGLDDLPMIKGREGKVTKQREGGKNRSYWAWDITSPRDALVGTSNLGQSKLQDNIYL